MHQKTDAEIVARVLKGDKQAYAMLINAYKGPVFNLAYRMTGSYQDAEDLTQETFIRAYQNLRQFDPHKKYFTWLYTIAINLIRNHLKKVSRNAKIRREDHLSSELQTMEGEGREEDPCSDDRMSQLEENIRRLPVEMREAILLKYHQDLTFEEVADITGESLSAVKMRIYRGLEKLKAMMIR